jgi:hypothetical protein
MRTTLELPNPLFARLKARAASVRVTLKQPLHSYVEQGLSHQHAVRYWEQQASGAASSPSRCRGPL